jgi:membrane associated rhomboid family serine protease
LLYNHGLKDIGGVAYWAHVGGFVSGIVLIKIIPGRAQYSHGGWFTKEGKEVLPKQ